MFFRFFPCREFEVAYPPRGSKKILKCLDLYRSGNKDENKLNNKKSPEVVIQVKHIEEFELFDKIFDYIKTGHISIEASNCVPLLSLARNLEINGPLQNDLIIAIRTSFEKFVFLLKKTRKFCFIFFIRYCRSILSQALKFETYDIAEQVFVFMCKNYENISIVTTPGTVTVTGTNKINSLCLWLKDVTQRSQQRSQQKSQQKSQQYPGIRIIPKFPLLVARQMNNDIAMGVLAACDQMRQLAPQNFFENVCSLVHWNFHFAMNLFYFIF